MTRFLAVDWGTTNLRAWVVDAQGRIATHAQLPLGVSKLSLGEAERCLANTIRPQLEAADLPALLCGMVGSNLGWVNVPYLDCPVDLQGLRAGLFRVACAGPPVWIVPGLRGTRPDGGPDVMRGEETHVLGWANSNPTLLRGERLICHPGTHSKWVRLVNGRLEQFVTSMTGELFDLLSKYSVLQVREAAHDAAAFAAGLNAAGDGSALASRLFTTRSRVVGGAMAADKNKSYLSGLLIGAEVASTPRLLGATTETPVTLIGDPDLTQYYLHALRASGFTVECVGGEQAVLAGLTALAKGLLDS